MPDGTGVPPERPQAAAARVDPIQDLLARLNRDVAAVAARDPDLSRSVGQLASTVTRYPERVDNPELRTSIAYALQDYEKLAGPISTVPAALREEMIRLAGTAPSLQNDRLQDLVRQTPNISDRRLIGDIRELALTTGSQGGDQNRQEVRERVEALENRVRLGAMTASTAGPRSADADSATPTGSAQNNQSARQPDGSSATRPESNGAARNTAARSPAGDTPSSSDVPGWVRPQQQSTTENIEARQAPPIVARGAGALSMALGALASRWHDSVTANSESTSRPPSPIAERSARHEQPFQGNRDDAAISMAEKSQAAALNAVRDFANGPASNILTKIRDAARSEPGGMAAVLAEMRDGGRFAGLRTQLNADLATERGAAAAYDRMTGALAQHGTDRAAVDAIGARTNTAASLAAKFQQVDAEIGKAVSMLPGKTDGKSVMDELGDKLKQVLDRAVEAVKSVFTPSAERGARSSASPSPSP